VVDPCRDAAAHYHPDRHCGYCLASLLALQRMRADIFPSLGTPVIYVAQRYGGMDPAQMEGYMVNYYEYHFLYITGIEQSSRVPSRGSRC
jgi:multidrug efflux pump subunit AcrB